EPPRRKRARGPTFRSFSIQSRSKRSPRYGVPPCSAQTFPRSPRRPRESLLVVGDQLEKNVELVSCCAAQRPGSFSAPVCDEWTRAPTLRAERVQNRSVAIHAVSASLW